MTQGIGGKGSSNIDSWQRAQEEESGTNRAAREYCTHADSVISGVLCSEDAVVSDACRAGQSDVDRMLCDDKQLQAAQNGIWQTMKNALQALFGALVGKAPP
jgi:hypothetical protein